MLFIIIVIRFGRGKKMQVAPFPSPFKQRWEKRYLYNTMNEGETKKKGGGDVGHVVTVYPSPSGSAVAHPPPQEVLDRAFVWPLGDGLRQEPMQVVNVDGAGGAQGYGAAPWRSAPF